MKTLRASIVAFAALVLMAGHVLGQAKPQIIQGAEVEEFLKTAKVITIKDIGKGITIPRKATMELNGVTGAGVFKTIDEKPLIGVAQMADGKIDSEFQDSWKTEVAAYELDKLIDLGMVPATVERRYDNKVGSMQFWVTSIMNEQKRQTDKVAPPDPSAWNDQMHKLFVWDNLIYNVDRNHGNILITADWKIVAIDHSRTFRPYTKLKDPKLMVRFSRSMLAKLDSLTEPILKARLNNYLTPFQIQGVLKRRDLIAAYAKQLAKDKGDAAVYYQ